MTNKSSEWSTKKEKKGSSNLDTKSYKKKVGPAKPKTPPMMVEPILLKPVNPVTIATKSVGLFDAKKKKIRVKKSRSRVRSFISLSIVSYLGYHALYACGSPFENTEKPAICAAIDPIKLDLYSAYKSKLFQTNAAPYLSPLIEKGNALYLQYGIPAQSVLSELYWQHGKPLLDGGCVGAHQIYKQKAEPLYLAKVAPFVNPYLAQAKPYYNQQLEIYSHQFQVLLAQSTQKAAEARAFAQYKWDHLPPHIQQAKEAAQAHILDWIHRAENTDLLPILEKYYWILVDFIQLELLPVIKASNVVTEIHSYYQTNVKHYVDLNIKPVLAPLPVAKLLRFIEAQLPTRPASTADQVYAATTASTQFRTAPIVPKTQDIPITPPAASAKTVIITKPSAPAFATYQRKPEPTIGKYGNNNDIIQEKSVKPTAATEYAPDPEEAEAIYVPTCNSAEEQLVVANTDKHLVAVPTDKDLFEVHKEEQLVIQAPIQQTEKETPTAAEEDIIFSIQTIVPTVSEEEVVFRIQTEVPVVEYVIEKETPVKEGVTEAAAPTPFKEDVIETVAHTAIETEVSTAVEEDIVFSIQTEVPTPVIAEEDIVFSIQTKVPTAVVAEEDIVFSTQTEVPTAVVAEEDIVFSIQTEVATAVAKEQTFISVQSEAPKAIPTFIKQDAEDNNKLEEHEKAEEPKAEEPKAEEPKAEELKAEELKAEELKAEKPKAEEPKKEENIFVPAAIEKEELVLESRKEHDADEPIFVKVDESAAAEHIDYEEPIVKVEDIEGPIVKVKIPVKVEEQEHTVKSPLAKQHVEVPVQE